MQDKSSLEADQDNDGASLDVVLSILGDYLTKSKLPLIPPGLQDNEALSELLQHLVEVRTALAGLSQGDLGTPISLRGYMGGLLKTFQGNLRHMLWMINQVAEGRLTHRIDCMGDFERSFNIMTHAIESARTAIEHQKELYAKLAAELKVEVEARIKAQEALKHELAHQQELAETDVLTGVSNRRAFMTMAAHELERCRRGNAALCLSMMDLDHFKTINDTFGHQVGDKVLQHAAAAIARNSRSYDVIGRYGGDEFILLFPSTTIEEALSALQRLKESLDVDDFASCEGARYTISAGLSAILPHQRNLTLDDLIENADKALYQAKKQGRNRILVLLDED